MATIVKVNTKIIVNYNLYYNFGRILILQFLKLKFNYSRKPNVEADNVISHLNVLGLCQNKYRIYQKSRKPQTLSKEV